MIEIKDGKYILKGVLTEFSRYNKNGARGYYPNGSNYTIQIERIFKINKIFKI